MQATAPEARAWHRRARPLLGTLIDIGVALPDADAAHAACDAAYAAIAKIGRAHV